MNVMPKVAPAIDTDNLRLCVPYLVRHKASGEVKTAIKVRDAVLYIDDSNTSCSTVTFFEKDYEIIRVFNRGVDTVTIGAW